MSKFDEFLSQAAQPLPCGWHWTRLGDVCKIVAGQSPASETYRRQPEGLPFFQGKADFGKVHPVPRVWCVQPIKYAYKSDILISMRAPVGPTNVADSECCIGRGLSAVRPDPNLVLTEYALWWLKNSERDLARLGSGSTFEAITNQDLASFGIPLPPLHQQERIAAILNEQMTQVDRARAATDEQLRAARELPNAFLRAVFDGVEARTWPAIRLGAVCDIVAKQVDPKVPEFGNLPHVNGENIISGTGRLKNIRTAMQDGMTSGKYLFNAGDVLYSKLRPYLRKVAVADFTGVCSADMYPIRVDADKLDPNFTLWMLLSEGFTKYADEQSRRARMPKLNREQLFAYEVALPSLDEQRRIAALINAQMQDAMRLVADLEGRLEAINVLPTEMMARAFRGELAVSRLRRPVPKKVLPSSQWGRPAAPDRISYDRHRAPITLSTAGKARATILAYFADKQCGTRHYGRLKEVKLLNLAETQIGLPLGGVWKRAEYGPFDSNIYDLERFARSKKWFAERKHKDGKKVEAITRYSCGQKIDEAVADAIALFGDKHTEMDRIIDLFLPLNVYRTELIVTTHSAWNDLLIDGKTPTDDGIVCEVRENWHPSKVKFSPDKIADAIQWLRDNNMVPRGTGPRTEARVTGSEPDTQ